MKHQTITADYLSTICWYNNAIVDWAASGKVYLGQEKQIGRYHYGFGDAAIMSANGQYVFIYKRLGTKGLLLKNGELIREINRSYYFAGSYEYPAAFIDFAGKTYLVHCPSEYCRLDFEEVETGKIITDVPGRNPSDIFHSRLEVSPDNRFLIVKGWHWHPLHVVIPYCIADCIADPLLLDKSRHSISDCTEICTASFISDTSILIGTSNEIINDDEPVDIGAKQVGIWDIASNKITHTAKVNGEFGNLFAINDELAWDTYKYPKIINIKTGDIIDEEPSFDSGMQNSSIFSNQPQIVFNRETKQLAISGVNCFTVITP